MSSIAGNTFGSSRWRQWTRLRIASLVALTAGVAGFLLSAGILGGGIEDRLGQFVLFRLRGPLPPPPEVVVVAEDRAAAEALGLPSGNRPNWRHG